MTKSAMSKRQWLFVSDIDETLTGDDVALQKLADLLGEHRDRIWFAVNSSRPSLSVSDTLNSAFPASLVPDAIITAMGTEISLQGNPLSEWGRRFDGWPQVEIFDVLASLGHQPHDMMYQAPLKVSFAVPPEDQPAARQQLEKAGLPCQIVTSGRDDFDVLPPRAGKGEATKFLATKLGCPVNRVVASGDSGNDIELLRAAACRIVVGNARKELVEALPPEPFFHAKRYYAAGVIEGLTHFGVLAHAVPGPA